MMRKKLVLFLVSILSLVFVLGFTACGGKDDGGASDGEVKGKVYRFSDATAVYGNGVSQEVKDEVNAELPYDKIGYNDSSFNFYEDGVCVFKHKEGNGYEIMSGSYSQTGAKIVCGEIFKPELYELTQNGNTLTLTFDYKNEYPGVKKNYTFVLVEGAMPDGKPDDGNTDDSGNTGTQTQPVAGKTFVFYDLVLSYDSTVDDAVKTQMNAARPAMKDGYAGSTIAFSTDGKFTMTIGHDSSYGTYTQDGTKLVLTVEGNPQEFTLSGDTVSVIMEITSGISMTLSYKVSNS